MSINYPQLILMGAGMSRRFGVLKQLDVLEACGNSLPEFIIDDAISAGFERICIVVRKEILQAMESFYAPRFGHRVDLRFVCQTLDDLVDTSILHTRTKPWGTAHAVLAARKYIDAPFATANSDDYYGPAAFKTLYTSLASNHDKDKFFLMGYKLMNTLSPFGPVSRALCTHNGSQLDTLVEHTRLQQEHSEVISLDEQNKKIASFTGDELVSMNLYGLSPQFLDYAETLFSEFLNDARGNLEEKEFLLPGVIQQMITENRATVDLLSCEEQWFGMTYPQDRPYVEKNLLALKKQGMYADI